MQGGSHRWTATGLLAVFILGGIGWSSAVWANDPRGQSAIRHLKKAVTPQRDDSHLARLISLRSMRDPSLERLYTRLLANQSWRVQVHAVLGLAEISDDGKVMPWLITQVQPDARSQILSVAMDDGLLSLDGIDDLTSWKDLEEPNRLALLAHRHSLEGATSASTIKPLTDSENQKVAAAAWLFLAWIGTPDATNGINRVLEDLPEGRQLDILLTMTMMIRRYEILQALPWLDQTVSTLRAENRFPEIVRAGTATLLKLDPALGLAQWREELGTSPSRRQQIDAALMLLHSGVALPAPDQQTIDVTDQLVNAIITTSNAVSRGHDETPERILELADLNHVRSTTLLPSVIDGLPDDQAKTVLIRLLDRVDDPDHDEMDRILAIEATHRLLQIDPDIPLSRLLTTADDSSLQEVVLFSLTRQRVPDVLPSVSQIRRIGLSSPDALALLLIARESTELDDTQLHQLGLVASGAALPSGLQTQAAWLYLKHTDQLDAAMAHLVPEQP